MSVRQRKIGDRFFRLPRAQVFRILITLPKGKHFTHLLASNSLLVGVLGIAVLIVLGAALLMLPVARSGDGSAPPLTAFFTATSAVSTTGLVLETTATYWSPFGQAVICGLIFAGGLGLVTVVMFILWLMGSRFTIRDRLLTREALAAERTGGLLRLLRNVVLLDVSITAVGAIVSVWSFRHYYDPAMTVWQALFHSVSSFNTAGFDIVGPSGFVPFRNDVLLLSVATVEAVMGAVGFSALLEVPKVHSFRRFSLDTKLVLVTTLGLYLLATTAVFASESLLGTTLAEFSAGGKVFTAFFNALSACTTTGYATIDFGQVTTQTLLVLTVAMFIGGATASTAGGIKVNTFAVLASTCYSAIRGKRNTEAFGWTITPDQVLRAITVAAVSIAVLATGVMLIMASSPGIPPQQIVFEASSAMATVGLSTGALLKFSVTGKMVVIFLMFVGRVAPISVITIFVLRRRAPLYRFPGSEVYMG